MRDVYEKLNFPEGTYVNKTLDLSHFLEAKGITEIDKWVINNKIEKITIKRLLNVYNTNLKRKIKDGIDYSELLVIEVKINDNKAIYDAQRVVAKAIIYPTLLIIRFNDKFKFGMYKNRDNKRDNLQNTYSDIYFTGWLDLNNRYGRIYDIITDLVFDNCSDITNFYDLYKYYYRKIKDYKSVYVPLKIITLFLKVNKFCPSSSIKKEILQNCEYICVNPNEKSTLDLFKKSIYPIENSNTFFFSSSFRLNQPVFLLLIISFLSILAS